MAEPVPTWNFERFTIESDEEEIEEMDTQDEEELHRLVVPVDEDSSDDEECSTYQAKDIAMALSSLKCARKEDILTELLSMQGNNCKSESPPSPKKSLWL
ncbi:hypothetical protein Aduo_013628 [Ancylostoma duodenale]